MKPLAGIQMVLSWISVYPVKEETAKWKRFIFKAFPLVLIVGNLTGLASSSVYFFEFFSFDLESSLYALFQIAGQLNMTNAIVATFAVRHRIPPMFKSLENISNSGEEN